MATVRFMNEYQWKLPHNPPVPAEVVGAELDSLLAEHENKLTPKDLVDAARPNSSNLHQLFEWEDAVAAEQYRIHQARQHLNHLQIRVISAGEEHQEPVFIRVTQHVSNGDGPGYVSIKQMGDEEIQYRLFLESLRDAHRIWQKYQMVSRASLIVKALRHYVTLHEEEAEEAGIKLGKLYDHAGIAGGA